MGFERKHLYENLRSCDILDLIPCCDSIRGKKHTEVVVSIARMVAEDNQYRKAIGRQQSTWTIPRDRRNNFAILNNSMKSEKAYEKNCSNYSRYLKKMEDEKVIHAFGVRDLKCYRVEKCILLWACYNPNNITTLPGPIIDFIDSGEDLIASMILGGSKRDRTLKRSELECEFSNVVQKMVSKLPPDLQKGMLSPAPGVEVEYVAHVREKLAKVDALSGVARMDISFKAIPRDIWRLGFKKDENDAAYADLIPRDSAVGHARSKPYIKPSAVVEDTTSAGYLLDLELDVCHNSVHCQEYLLRVLRRNNKTDHARNITGDIREDLASVDQVWKKLLKNNSLDPITLRCWANWFAKRPTSLVVGSCHMRRFANTWREYCQLEEAELPDVKFMEPSFDIAEHVDEIMLIEGVRRGTVLSMMIYGPMITHACLVVEMKRGDAIADMKVVFEAFSKLSEDRKEFRCKAITEAVKRCGTYAGPMSNPKLTRLLSSFFKSIGMELGVVDGGLPKDTLPEIVKFWNIMESRF